MQALQRIRLIWTDIVLRVRTIFSNSQTVILNVDVTSDSIAVAADNKNPTQSTQQVKLSGSTIKLDDKEWLTEEALTLVLNCHPRLQDVTQLLVHNSRLSSIPVSIGKLANLTLLDLSSNYLQDLPWSIVCLKKLKILNLSNNNFYTIPPIVGHLTSLQQLILNNNSLEYLPTSLVYLENLQVLQVSGNGRLIAPPLHVCSQGLGAVFKHLRKRHGRSNLWSNSTPFYVPVEDDSHCFKMKSLLEICVAKILEFNIDFFSLPYVPPPLKRHLYDRSKEELVAARVAKCSQCYGFFSSQAHFNGHDCLR